MTSYLYWGPARRLDGAPVKFVRSELRRQSRQRRGILGRLIDWVRITHLDVQAKGLHFLDQNVERFGHSRLERVVALDDALVNARASLHVVGLHGEKFLQRVSRAVRFH